MAPETAFPSGSPQMQMKIWMTTSRKLQSTSWRREPTRAPTRWTGPSDPVLTADAAEGVSGSHFLQFKHLTP